MAVIPLGKYPAQSLHYLCNYRGFKYVCFSPSNLPSQHSYGNLLIKIQLSSGVHKTTTSALPARQTSLKKNNSDKIDIKHLTCLITLADLGGVPGTRPPKGPDSFVLTYKIFETGVHAPSTRSTPPYGKSWIRHCITFLI